MKSDLFRAMPPKRHDRRLDQSAVVQHIAETLGESLEQAARTFRYLRNKGHVVFEQRGRWWRGAEFVPLESTEERAARTQAELNQVRGEVSRLAALVDKLRASHNALAESFHDHQHQL